MKQLRKTLFFLFSIFLLAAFQFRDKKTAQDIADRYVNKMSATLNNLAFSAFNTNGAKNSYKGGYQLRIDDTSISGQRITVAINNNSGGSGSFDVMPS